MKIRCMAVVVLAGIVGGCGFDGRPLITEDLGRPIEDNQELSVSVKQALRRAPQTAVENISVMMVSEDTVRLTGYVSDDATLVEAERVANNVPGVRFVVNTLNVRR